MVVKGGKIEDKDGVIKSLSEFYHRFVKSLYTIELC